MEKVQFGTTVLAETVQAIERLTKMEDKTKGEIVDLAIAAYDRGEVLPEVPVVEGEMISLPVPQDRDMLADCIGNLVAATRARMHENHVLSALGVVRSQVVRSLPEYKDAERMRQEWQERRETAGRPLSYTQKGATLK